VTADRRASGLIRVPFVRRCVLDVQGAEASSTAFLVNINVLGGYVARDDLPTLGSRLTCRFQVPDSELEVLVSGVVAWLNPKQQHPVHSLPPGFGIKFERLTEEARQRIERIVLDHISRHPDTR
jgi:Tfp pilus assembly protein PilZ